MKIGLASTTIGKRGGISRYVTELAERYCKTNELHLLTSELQYDTSVYHDPLDYFKLKEANIHNIPLYTSPESLRVISAAYSYSKLRRELDVDIFHSQGVECINPDVFTATSCHTYAVKKFKAERGIMYSTLKTFEPLSNIVSSIERYNCVKSDCHIIAISNGTKDELVHSFKIPPRRISVIHLGVDTDKFNPGNRKVFRDKILAQHNIPLDSDVILFVGYELKRKGLATLLHAFSKLKDKYLIVVGPYDLTAYTPYLTLARHLGVSERVICTNGNMRVEEYFAAADLFAFPTSYEPFGLVITEGMAAGLPVVTSKIAGATELMEDKKDCVLLNDYSDVDELVSALTYALDNRKMLGANARQTAEFHSWDHVAKETMRLYEDLHW